MVAVWILLVALSHGAAAFSPLPSFTSASSGVSSSVNRADLAAGTCPNPSSWSMMGYVTNPAPAQISQQNVRNVRNIDRLKALASTVASIKQEISRRDMLHAVVKRLASSSALLTAAATIQMKRAYAEEPAGAADKCPDLKELGRKSRPPGFSEDLYQGVWYELAYHDVTQANYFCGCTRFNFTKRGATFIEDMFTTTCPMTGILPGEDVAKKVYTLNMTIQYDKARPGEFVERGFAYNFPNVVLFVWTKTGPDGRPYYDRALQMQCVESGGRILFVGINFLARSPEVPKAELDQLFDKAQELGLDRYGGDRAGMYMVVHRGCRYPVSTDASVMGPRTDFPGPLLTDTELYSYPDRRVDIYAR